MTNSNGKDVVYVDIDDEITTIIDKVRASQSRIVALVLPKRATVFQSIVNMKLLKRSADYAKKNLVLVTTESGLMPLAAAAGLHVAATPQSKPEIPAGVGPTSDDETIEDNSGDGYTAANAGDRPVGDLVRQAQVPPTPNTDEAIETVDLPGEAEEANEETSNQPEVKPEGKHPKVPNFNKFRLYLFLGVVLLVGIVVLLYFGLAILPRAAITIGTNTSNLNVNLTMILDTNATAVDTAKLVVPAKVEQQQKTTTEQVATTGQKNKGNQAIGSVTMTAGECSGNVPAEVAAGTGMSTNGLTFITQVSTSFSPVVSNGQCVWQASSSTAITAQTAGAKYNVSNATFTVAGRSDVSASGSTSGGSDNVVQIVVQADIDNAKQKLATQDSSSIKDTLASTLQQEGYYPLPATFTTGTPNVTTSNNVGDEATNLTATQITTYTMAGAKEGDLQTLIKSSLISQIDSAHQAILDDGLSNANMNVVSNSGTTTQVTLQTTAVIGPSLDINDLKRQVAGKKSGDAKTLISNLPGVTTVDVHLSPFWVGSIPGNTQKITITVSKAAAQTHGG